MVQRFLRWLTFLPAGFLASIIAGAAAYWIINLFGGESWYLWLVSGAASGGAFIVAAFYVAPPDSNRAKWISVMIVGLLGLMSGLGPLLVWREPVRAFAGFAMVLVAIHFGKDLRAKYSRESTDV